MLTRIVSPSPALKSFLQPLVGSLMMPQQQHVLNMADALLVTDDHKTLATLQRQFLDTSDPSNWADFLRISPWSAADMRNRLRGQQLAWLLAEAEHRGLPKVLYLNIDDSLGKKDKHTHCLEPVDWFYDHNESTRHSPRYYKAFCYVECTAQIGPLTVTLDLRLYLRAKTVRRLNRHRPIDQHLAFRSKNTLARAMLESLRPLLPAGWSIIVQFDSWYASERLLKYIHRCHWHAVCALKSNRKLQGQRLRQFVTTLPHRRYTRVRVAAADGHRTTYYARDAVGHLERVPFDVRVIFSKRHPQAQTWSYFLSTDLARKIGPVLRGYGGRWSCEVVNFYVKTQLGMADFRVRSFEAVDRYVVVVHLAWAYVERRYAQERSAQVRCAGDLIRRHRDEHAQAWLTAALQEALATGRIEPVLQRFLRQSA